MNREDILYLALRAGAKILESGAEAYRVEDTMNRILLSYGIKDAQSWVTPTGIIVSGVDENGHSVTRLRRIPSLKVDLEKISLINALSRDITVSGLTPEEFSRELDLILNKKPYSLTMDLLSSALVAGSFTLLFGGGASEAFTAAVTGPAILLTGMVVRALKLSSFFQNAFGGMTAVLLAMLSMYLGIVPEINNIITGSIMLLVPGISMTNAIRDTFQGDYLSGVTRAAEALVTASGIAFGTALGFYIGRIF